MKNMLRFSATLLLCASIGVIGGGAGCKKAEPTAAAPPPSGAPPAVVPTTPAPANPAPGPSHAPAGAEPGQPGQPGRTISGKVAEKIDTGSYSYLRIQTSTGETWAAIPTSTVAVGEQVTVLAQMDMDGFESKTLNRKFDKLVFGTIPGASPGATAAGMPNPHAVVPGTPGVTASTGGPMPPGHPTAAPAAEVGDVNVPKAAGADARTVAEVFAQKGALKDKPVTVRGKVVKYMGSVMGKNWLHLRDGSGTDSGKDNDLTVTTSDITAVGDVVTVRGPVHLDRDFGAGYSYGVIVEDAKVEKSAAK